MTHNADGSILIGDNIIVRRSRLPGVFVIANDEDETFIEKQYIEELIQALQILRFGQ